MKKPVLRRVVDLLMAVALLLLMSYSLIGEAAHEWIGIGMFLLFVLHLILNRNWIAGLRKGRCSAYRVVQTVLVLLCFQAMVGLMASGIILSQHVFPALHIRGLSDAARQLHMLCSFWGFGFMSLHLGLHWSAILHMANRFAVTKRPVFRLLGWLTAAYGVYAFGKRRFPGYLLQQTHFLFLDYEEPLIFFFADHLAIMGTFIFCAHYGKRLLTRRKRNI